MKVVTQNVLTEPMLNQKEHKIAVMSKRSESFNDNTENLASCTAKVTEHAEQCETD